VQHRSEEIQQLAKTQLQNIFLGYILVDFPESQTETGLQSTVITPRRYEAVSCRAQQTSSSESEK
jgi:hypothetical protein